MPLLAQEASGDYATDLGRVYGGYQRMFALKDACDAVVPATRPANAKAFAGWLKLHEPLADELRRRVMAMIRGASKDEEDYARNLGRYQGLILQEREEYTATLRALGADELRGQCERLPDELRGPRADLNKVYAEELRVIRARK
jgi:hypothetical protein